MHSILNSTVATAVTASWSDWTRTSSMTISITASPVTMSREFHTRRATLATLRGEAACWWCGNGSTTGAATAATAGGPMVRRPRIPKRTPTAGTAVSEEESVMRCSIGVAIAVAILTVGTDCAVSFWQLTLIPTRALLSSASTALGIVIIRAPFEGQASGAYVDFQG